MSIPILYFPSPGALHDRRSHCLFDHERVSTTSLLLLRPLLMALGASKHVVPTAFAGLPAPCIHLSEVATAICATPIRPVRKFRSRMVAAACERNLDVVLVRHGLISELLDEVTFDAVMHRDAPLDIFSGMVAYRADDGGFWLVPPPRALGDSIRIDSIGLTISAQSPYRSIDERCDGVARAAAEIVRSFRRSDRS